MIENQRVQEKEQAIQQPEQNNKIQAELAPPVSQQIVQKLVKINGERSSKVYKKIGFLGKGGFAQCFLTKQVDNQRTAATKIIPKKLLDSHRTKLRLANQIKLHKHLHHENVVEFYNNFQDDQNVYINLQVCEYGSINDLIKTRYTFTAPQAQSFLYGICHGLKYLHSRGIIHRDLKLGNIFLDSNLKTKIGDFGLACKLQFIKQMKRTVCGTPNYIAPQVLQGKGYHFQVDIWAVGVMLYTLFFTFPPFETEQPHTTYLKIKKCQYEFPKFIEAPPQAIDLIKKILVSDPSRRLTLDEILDSPFMRMGNSIPLGLPPCSIKRPPNKKQLAAWPKIQLKQEQSQKSLNGTILGYFGKSKKTQKSILKQRTEIFQTSLKISDKKRKSQQISLAPIFCKSIEEASSQLVTFYLNNGNFGVYQKARATVYTSQLKDNSQKMQQTFKKSSLSQSGAVRQQQIQCNQCPHKVILSIKYKQLVQSKMQVLISDKADNTITVEKINIYKDVKMVRLTNRMIQIIYKQNDGFLLSSNRRNVYYFDSFSDLQTGHEVNLEQILQQKQNATHSAPNIIASIFKSQKAQKNYLTMKKINYLKVILKQSISKGLKKSN